MAVEIWAHRGKFSISENTMEAFASALALGGQTAGLMCILPAINRLWLPMMRASRGVSNGCGRVVDQTLAQLRSYNFHKTKPESVQMAKIRSWLKYWNW